MKKEQKREPCEHKEIDLSKLSKRTSGQLPLWLGYNLKYCIRRGIDYLKKRSTKQ